VHILSERLRQYENSLFFYHKISPDKGGDGVAQPSCRQSLSRLIEEKQLILEHLFKGGGQDSSSLKGTWQAFSRNWVVVGLVFSGCLKDLCSGLVACFSYCWICRDFLWIQVAIGFSVPRSAELVFSRTVGFILSLRRLSHGSDNCFSSGWIDDFVKGCF
jgi:hypothetical protein